MSIDPDVFCHNHAMLGEIKVFLQLYTNTHVSTNSQKAQNVKFCGKGALTFAV